MRKRRSSSIIGQFELLIVSVGAIAWAQHDHASIPEKDQATPKSDCQMMGEHMQQMRAMMQKMDQQLDAKVQAMNQASGDAKVAAMADVINELVSQRKQMHEKMSQMRQKMMGHMAKHMQMGMNEDDKKAMMQCPMMKQMMQDKPLTKYTCPMHPEVVLGEPGACPKCGMAMTVSADEKEDASSRDRNGGDKHGDHREHDDH